VRKTSRQLFERLPRHFRARQNTHSVYQGVDADQRRTFRLVVYEGGTTTLFAALDVATSKVIGGSASHRRQLRHPQAPQGQGVAQAPHPLLPPTSASWINLVERFFGLITDDAIRCGVSRSVAELEAAIESYLQQHNADAKLFVWTAPAADILAKVAGGDER
jgi:hypothetical protein